MFRKGWVLLCIGFLFAQTEMALVSNQYNKLKINKQKTTQNLIWLSVVTVLPFLSLFRLIDSPEFDDEIYINVAFFSLPSILGWSLFAHESSRYKKHKKPFPENISQLHGTFSNSLFGANILKQESFFQNQIYLGQ